MDTLNRLSEAIIAGEDELASSLVAEALGAGVTAKDVLDNGLLAGMGVVGKQFKDHEIFLPDVLMAAKAMAAGMKLIEPLLTGDDAIGVVFQSFVRYVQPVGVVTLPNEYLDLESLGWRICDRQPCAGNPFDIGLEFFSGQLHDGKRLVGDDDLRLWNSVLHYIRLAEGCEGREEK